MSVRLIVCTIVTAALWCAAAAGTASAQVTTGTVAGTVKDAQGGVIPGATVIADQRDARHELDAGRHQHAPATSSSPTSRRTPTPSK